MKQVSSVIQALKFVIKYASYVVVIIDIVNFAIERIEKEVPRQEIDLTKQQDNE